MKNIVLVDDDTLSREGIATYVNHIIPDTVIYEFEKLSEANDLKAINQAIDIFIIKLQQYASKTLSCLNELKHRFLNARILVITERDYIPQIQSISSTGSITVIAKNTSRCNIQNSIRAVLVNAHDKSNNTASSSYSAAHPHDDEQESTFAASNQSAAHKLTQRQRQVIEHIVQGHSNKRIAYELGISEGTIKLHVSSIFKALKVTNRTQAALVYSRSGIN